MKLICIINLIITLKDWQKNYWTKNHLIKIVNILGDRPFEPKDNYKKFLEIKHQDAKEMNEDGEN
jgi:hypothetical protein